MAVVCPVCSPGRCQRFAREPVGTLVLPSDTSVIGAVPSAGTSAAGWFCPMAVGERSTSEMATPRGSLNFPAVLVSVCQPWEGAGRFCTPHARAPCQCAVRGHARGWAHTLQRCAGIGVIVCGHCSPNGFACRGKRESSADRTAAQHFGRVASKNGT